MKLSYVGVDLAKNEYQLHSVDRPAEVSRQDLRSSQGRFR